ncbi:transposase [Klebsiella pneumoniae]|nr:transposase [Klebsiella pneumoniae]
MAKPKYSPETKLAVVNHYLSGKDGEQSTADLFGEENLFSGLTALSAEWSDGA